MTTNHPIIPSPELVEQWTEDLAWGKDQVVFTRAAQWGADQELEACIEEVQVIYGEGIGACIRGFRRPKPPSLRKQAYEALDTYVYGNPDPKDKERTYNTIRKALEQLND